MYVESKHVATFQRHLDIYSGAWSDGTVAESDAPLLLFSDDTGQGGQSAVAHAKEPTATSGAGGGSRWLQQSSGFARAIPRYIAIPVPAATAGERGKDGAAPASWSEDPPQTGETPTAARSESPTRRGVVMGLKKWLLRKRGVDAPGSPTAGPTPAMLAPGAEKAGGAGGRPAASPTAEPSAAASRSSGDGGKASPAFVILTDSPTVSRTVVRLCQCVLAFGDLGLSLYGAIGMSLMSKYTIMILVTIFAANVVFTLSSLTRHPLALAIGLQLVMWLNVVPFLLGYLSSALAFRCVIPIAQVVFLLMLRREVTTRIITF